MKYFPSIVPQDIVEVIKPLSVIRPPVEEAVLDVTDGPQNVKQEEKIIESILQQPRKRGRPVGSIKKAALVVPQDITAEVIKPPSVIRPPSFKKAQLTQQPPVGKSYESFDRKRALVKYQSQSEVIKVIIYLFGFTLMKKTLHFENSNF